MWVKNILKEALMRLVTKDNVAARYLYDELITPRQWQLVRRFAGDLPKQNLVKSDSHGAGFALQYPL